MRRTERLRWCCSAPTDEFLEKPETEIEEMIHSCCGGECILIFVVYLLNLEQTLKVRFRAEQDKHQNTKTLALIGGNRSSLE